MYFSLTFQHALITTGCEPSDNTTAPKSAYSALNTCVCAGLCIYKHLQFDSTPVTTINPTLSRGLQGLISSFR